MVKYEIRARLRDAEPNDFKIIENQQETFKYGVVYFTRNSEWQFFGPYVTGYDADPYEIKELLESKLIYVML